MAVPDPTAEFVAFHRPEAFDGLELLTAHYYDHEFSPHVHEGYCIALIEQGAERFYYRGTEHHAPAGTIALVNPDEVHTGSRADEDGWSYRVFYADPGLVQTVCQAMGSWQGGTPYFPEAIIRDPELIVPLRGLHYALSHEVSALERESRWYEVISQLLQRHAQGHRTVRQPAAERGAVRQVRDVLRERFADTPSLSELASQVGLSPWHLNRVFREQMGLPPHAYVTQVRLARAKTLLRGPLPMAELAAVLGFADQAHLGRQFKRAFGVTPGQYRQAA
ncbi:AraC family transcriptional regulator [Chitinimonas sp.]|uniref:AraC family transcriptional regulator n=1 Tax=Chitinimonas sp. TaxID=1934313 RepID=UPI002F9368AB